MKALSGICGFFLFSYLIRVTQSSWSIPVWQLIKSFQKPWISWFAFFFCCLLRTWPLEGAVLSDYNLSPVLAASWQLCLAAGDPRYLLLSIKHGKGPPQLSEWSRVLSNSFVALSVGGFLLLSWRIAMNYCAPRRGGVYQRWKRIHWVTAKCLELLWMLSIHLFISSSEWLSGILNSKLQIRTEVQRG